MAHINVCRAGAYRVEARRQGKKSDQKMREGNEKRAREFLQKWIEAVVCFKTIARTIALREERASMFMLGKSFLHLDQARLGELESRTMCAHAEIAAVLAYVKLEPPTNKELREVCDEDGGVIITRGGGGR